MKPRHPINRAPLFDISTTGLQGANSRGLPSPLSWNSAFTVGPVRRSACETIRLGPCRRLRSYHAPYVVSPVNYSEEFIRLNPTRFSDMGKQVFWLTKQIFNTIRKFSFKLISSLNLGIFNNSGIFLVSVNLRNVHELWYIASRIIPDATFCL